MMSQTPFPAADRNILADVEFRIVLVGEPTTPDFDAVADELLTTVPDATFRVVRDLPQFVSELENEDVPDLIIFVQTWPDEFRFSDLLALPWIGPLTQVLCVYGPWCVSDGRSRHDWPLALRVPLEHLGAEILSGYSRNLGRLEGPENPGPGKVGPPPSIPWTAGRDEVFAARYASDDKSPAGQAKGRLISRRVRIETFDLPQRQFWSELLTRAGYQLHDRTADVSCDLILWDADPAGGRRTNADLLEAWSLLKGHSMTAKIVVMTGFLVPEMLARWQALGAAAVICKLLPISALLARLKRICETA
jgi:hypothetical protein